MNMNIGDGLTLQTRVIGGKAAPGIFFLQNAESSKKFSQKTRQSKSMQDQGGAVQVKKIQNSDSKVRKKGSLSQTSRSIPGRSRNNGKNQLYLTDATRTHNAVDYAGKDSAGDVQGRATVAKKSRQTSDKTLDAQKQSSLPQRLQKPVRQATKKNMLQVDTDFVTLTQDQLNTILSLVKKQQEIDVGSVLKETNTPSESVTSVDGETKNSEQAEGESKSDFASANDENAVTKESSTDEDASKEKSDAESKPVASDDDKENAPRIASASAGDLTPLNKKETSGSKTASPNPTGKKKASPEVSSLLVGIGSREREKSRLERHRKQWLKDLDEQVALKKQQPHSLPGGQNEAANTPVIDRESKDDEKHRTEKTSTDKESAVVERQVTAQEIQKNLPSAVRSSFVLGESSPENDMTQSKKRQDQQKWKAELDLQLAEQQKRKKDTRNLTNDQMSDDALWFRHFDTLQPKIQRSEQIEAVRTERPSAESPHDHSPFNLSTDLKSSSVTSLSSGGGARELNETRGNHLRTMTSLLDPAQLDAMEVRRAKQAEHRRAIAAQVEERKRQKEQEALARKIEEEKAERRLEEDRRRLQKQYEMEKNRQREMEKKRAQQTEELYQQMEEAKATALREKLEQRQRSLRNNGHDTSRLERAHQNVLLETNRFVGNRADTRSDINLAMPPIQARDVENHRHYQHIDTSPSALPPDRHPVSIIANADSSPIKLEISLNSPRLKAALVETAVQTEQRSLDFTGLDFPDSDAETEYLALPQPAGNRARKQDGRPRDATKKRSVQENNNNSSRRHEDAKQATVAVTDRPKWGVGQKKNYVPASQRYVNPIKRRTQQYDYDAYQRVGRENAAGKQDKAAVGERARWEGGRVPANDTGFKQAPKVTPRSKSPPVPAVRNRMRTQMDTKPDRSKRGDVRADSSPYRATSALSVTTDRAKYEPRKHSSESPVPMENDYVQYRRSDDVLGPGKRPETDLDADDEVPPQLPLSVSVTQPGNQQQADNEFTQHRSRQEKILREISILRQGLLLKQREVASYPVAMVTGSVGANLPERTNELKQDS